MLIHKSFYLLMRCQTHRYIVNCPTIFADKWTCFDLKAVYHALLSSLCTIILDKNCTALQEMMLWIHVFARLTLGLFKEKCFCLYSCLSIYYSVLKDMITDCFETTTYLLCQYRGFIIKVLIPLDFLAFAHGNRSQNTAIHCCNEHPGCILVHKDGGLTMPLTLRRRNYVYNMSTFFYSIRCDFYKLSERRFDSSM